MVTTLNGHVETFKQRFDTTETILIPIFTDEFAHPCANKLSLLYVRFLDNGDEFIVPYDHSETVLMHEAPPYLTSNATKFVPNRKEFRHKLSLSNLIDVNLLQYVSSGSPMSFVLENTKAHTLIKRNNPKLQNVNRIIPLSKHIESCRVLSSKMLNEIEKHRSNMDDAGFKFLNFSATDVFQQIEYAGLYSNIHNIVYTEYNLFTTTGRPSNRFGGVNYAALNKEDGTRKQFTSRFDNGMMILLDYDAYHLRLIAELLGFEFPEGNVHTELGKMYFKTDTLTEEQYNESKRISFQLLYGGITDEYRHVPFFEKVQNFIDFLWADFREKGAIVSPIGQRELYRKNLGHMHPQKLFNYFIQLHETEHNVMVLEKILPLFFEKMSKLVLYTYDSILIDFHPADGIELIQTLKKSLECENTYPMKVYVGSDYHSMTNVTNRFH